MCLVSLSLIIIIIIIIIRSTALYGPWPLFSDIVINYISGLDCQPYPSPQ
jgi:hypothetical protein